MRYGEIMSLYQEDLAFVQTVGFSDFATKVSPAIVEVLRGLPFVRTVADVGCGAGITTAALSEAGYEVVAIEPSGALLQIARRSAPRARFIQGSVYEVDLPACDAVLAVGEPLSYHEPKVDAVGVLCSLLARVRAALSPGGLFVFDVISSAGPSLDARAWKSDDEWAILYETREDRATARLTREIEVFRRHGSGYRRTKELHHVKLFDEVELARWLEQAGFSVQVTSAYGNIQLAPRRIAFFATRR